MLTKTKCWFESNTKIVPQLKQQYILKKDLSYEYEDKSQCRFDKGMVCELYSYNSEEGLELKIDLRTRNFQSYCPSGLSQKSGSMFTTRLEKYEYIFFHPINAKLEGGIGGEVFKQYKVSQFYDYFEEFDKDMTMADALDVQGRLEKLSDAVSNFNRAISEMDGDCNSFIADNYPFPMSFDDWVLDFYEWKHSTTDNIDTYRHAIKSLGGKDE